MPGSSHNAYLLNDGSSRPLFAWPWAQAVASCALPGGLWALPPRPSWVYLGAFLAPKASASLQGRSGPPQSFPGAPVVPLLFPEALVVVPLLFPEALAVGPLQPSLAGLLFFLYDGVHFI